MRYIEVLGQKLGREPILNLMPMQPGDVVRTEADVSDTQAAVGYEPTTSIEEGIGKFVDWYRAYHGPARD